MKIRQRLQTVSNIALCAIRNWWRPAMLAGVAVSTWVNLVIIPLVNWKQPDLAQASLWIAACGALQWVREWGKVKGAPE